MTLQIFSHNSFNRGYVYKLGSGSSVNATRTPISHFFWNAPTDYSWDECRSQSWADGYPWYSSWCVAHGFLIWLLNFKKSLFDSCEWRFIIVYSSIFCNAQLPLHVPTY